MTSNALYNFYNPVQIHFGEGIRSNLQDLLGSKKYLVVCSGRGRKQFTKDKILQKLIIDKQILWLDTVKESPTLIDIQKQIDLMKNEKFDAIIAFGGGSVIDSAKALSVSMRIKDKSISIKDLINSADINIPDHPIPLFTLPTTAGTGAEMTPFATFWDHVDKKKYSLDHYSLFPVASFIDPGLCKDLPKIITLSTGLDAINQACESIWNINASAYTLDIAFRALELGFRALPLIINENNEDARSDMSECSMLAGIAISQTRTAMCHSISYPLSSHFNVPHGIACAFSMREILKINLDQDDGRFNYLAKRLLGDEKSGNDLINFFEVFFSKLDVLNIFKSYINDIDSLKKLKGQMFTKARAKNSLVKISIKDMDGILERSLNQ
jgi:phosphonate metabolism-associated iron-containing alcohol dehydrogenase